MKKESELMSKEELLAEIARLGERLGEPSLARSSRTDQKAVALFDLHICVALDREFRARSNSSRAACLRLEPLVMIVNGDGQRLLGGFLPDAMHIEQFITLPLL